MANNNDDVAREVAGQKTAHVAGKAAASYFGGAQGAKIYDVASKTKGGQHLEQRLGQNIAHSRLGNLNKKLDDKGIVDKADQAMNLGSKSSSNVALAKNKANRSRFQKGLQKLGNHDTNTLSDSVGDVENEDIVPSNKESIFSRLSPKVKIKIILILAGVAGGFLLILLLISLIMTILNIDISYNAANRFGTNDYVSADGDDEASPQELAYYSKLEETANAYKNSCNIVLDKNYIHSVLITKYQENFEQFYNEFGDDELDVDSEDIDYNNLSSNIKTIGKLMINDCYVDYSIGGEFYNRLKNSSFFNHYYKDSLKESSADDILEMIFDFAEMATLENTETTDNMYVSEDLDVKISLPNSSKTISLKEYVKGSVYANVDSSMLNINNKEKIKAYTILYTTNILANGNYGTNLNSITIKNSIEGVLYCNPSSGCSMTATSSNNFYLQDGGSTTKAGGNNYYNGKYYYKKPISAQELAILNGAVDEVFGEILYSEGNTFKKLESDNLRYATGSDYKTILGSAYKTSTLKNIKEDNYTENVNYGNKVVKIDAVFYDQNNYPNVKFCGRSNASIKSSGCGVTAMAIVASTFVSKENDPVKMMNDAYNWGYCGKGISGTNSGFFSKEAAKLRINYLRVSKSGNLNLVTDALSSGNSLVIVNMRPGLFTNSGHYIVLGGINNATKEVYVYDPYHQVNVMKRNSGNGWYSFNNVIVKQARNFYILTKG